MKQLTPFGVRDYLPDELCLRDALLETIEKEFKTQAYQKIITPTLEFYDALQPAMSQTLQDACISFFDSTGARLILRPDHTLPIARIVSSRLSPLDSPQKLYYLDSVFRKDSSLGETEIFQAGVEHIGSAEQHSEADLIALCIRIFEALNISDYVIDIGHQSFADSHSQAEVSHLLNGDYIALGHLPIRGDISTVPDGHPLWDLHHELEKRGLADKVIYNQGLIKDPSYYNGVVFECNIKGFGETVGSGGRYDQVFEKFGVTTSAIGFALRVHRLEAFLRTSR